MTGLRSCDIILGNFVCPFSNSAGICDVPTADAVATDKVNSYTFIFRLRLLRRFAETTSQGYSGLRGFVFTSVSDPISYNFKDL